MGLERDGDPIADRGDDVGPEREVGDELPVHHVPLDEVDARLLERDDLVAESGEVGGEHGRGDQDRQGHRARRYRLVSGSVIVRPIVTMPAVATIDSDPTASPLAARRSPGTRTAGSCSSAARCRARWSSPRSRTRSGTGPGRHARRPRRGVARPGRAALRVAPVPAAVAADGSTSPRGPAARPRSTIVDDALRRTRRPRRRRRRRSGASGRPSRLPHDGPGRGRRRTAAPDSAPSSPTTSSPRRVPRSPTRRCSRSSPDSRSTPASSRRCATRSRPARSAPDGTGHAATVRGLPEHVPDRRRRRDARGRRRASSPGVARLVLPVRAAGRRAARRRGAAGGAGARGRRPSSSTPTPASGCSRPAPTAPRRRT